MNTTASHSPSRLPLLCLAALGVVFGDIGTSPLYAFREACAAMREGIDGGHGQVLIFGLLSLIIWSLILIISVKYILFVMRADKRGEGGILALLSVGFPERKGRYRTRTGVVMVAFGVFGAALLYGDGIITPAISVLSAVEGIKEHPDPGMTVPITVIILLLLFSVQKHGTAKVGSAFGPITFVWFLAIAALGIYRIAEHPGILSAFSPHHAIRFILHHEHGVHPLHVLGGVFLVVTGGEALYADMGHFGRRPIKITWFALVLPALLLNYLGQGAMVLNDPSLADKPFYSMIPSESFRIPLVILATAATVIASQALITGAYSLTMQAVQLGYLPRMKIDHTSSAERGQIYIGRVNWMLAILCILLVITWKTSTNLAHAYGMAVTLTMLITTILFYYAARREWNWPVWKALPICVFFAVVELVFVTANAVKFMEGAWFPLALGVVLFAVMVTWRTGRRILGQKLMEQSLPLDDFVASVARGGATRVKGTAVYMAGTTGVTPTALLHNLKHNKVLHDRIIFLTVESELIPFIDEENRLSIEQIAEGMWRVIGHYGFMERPDVPELLQNAASQGLAFNAMQTSFFLGRETIIPGNKYMSLWRAKLFSILSRNSQSAVAYYNIPPGRVVEFGIQIEL